MLGQGDRKTQDKETLGLAGRVTIAIMWSNTINKPAEAWPKQQLTYPQRCVKMCFKFWVAVTRKE